MKRGNRKNKCSPHRAAPRGSLRTRRRTQPACERHPRRFNRMARLINAASQRSEPFVSVVSESQAADHRNAAVFQALMRAGRLASLRRDGEVRRSGLGRVQGECLPTNRSRPPSSRKCSRRQPHPLLSLRSLLQLKSGVLTAAVSLPGRGTCG